MKYQFFEFVTCFKNEGLQTCLWSICDSCYFCSIGVALSENIKVLYMYFAITYAIGI